MSKFKPYQGILASVTLIATALLAAAGPAFAARAALTGSGSEGRRYDVIIEGARIVDGTGNPWFYGDLAVSADAIAWIGPRGGFRDATARERIDAKGLVVAPGFID